MKKTLAFVLVVSLLLSFSIPAFAAAVASPSAMGIYAVTCGTLNVRMDPSTANKPLAQVHRGDLLEVFSMDNGWAKIGWFGGYAYVSAQYIQLFTPGTPAGDSAALPNVSNTQLNVAGGGVVVFCP